MSTQNHSSIPRQARLIKVSTDVIITSFCLLFTYAAASKLLEYDKFLLQMSKSPIITDYATILVWMIPTLEIVTSIMLLLDQTRLQGLYAALCLMVLFTAYIYVILNYSDVIPCSCGGVLEQLGWEEHLIFNLGFVGLALAGILLQAKIERDRVVIEELRYRSLLKQDYKR